MLKEYPLHTTIYTTADTVEMGERDGGGAKAMRHTRGIKIVAHATTATKYAK